MLRGTRWAGEHLLTSLSVVRYSVSVFQPPFQPGRMALESQSPGCTTLLSTSSLEAGDSEREPSQSPELQLVAEGDTGVPRLWAAPDRGPVTSTSGISSEMLTSGPTESSSLPVGERVSRPEGRNQQEVLRIRVGGSEAGDDGFDLVGKENSHDHVLL